MAAFQMPTFLSRFLRPFTTSTSLSLQPDALAAKNFPPNTERAIVAGGCFWGVEEIYRETFKNKGLLDCRVGYTGGETEAPSYSAVCTGRTGHAESLLLLFDPDKLSYRQIIEFFFRMHDPTTKNRQGADSGTQYRSAVFATTEAQLNIANEIKEKVGKEWYKGKPITTQVAMATQWWDAEKEHQDYLAVQGGGYRCPAHFARPLAPLSS